MLQKIFNFFPSFKGKLRLARLLYDKDKSRYFRTPSGLFFTVPNLQEIVSLELFVNGIYEKETIDFICKSLPENGIFIDVGANIGAISIEVANARKDVSVYAFEASPRVFNYLKRNQTQNNVKNLFVYNLAVHERNDIELPFYSPIVGNGKGSFSPVFTNTYEVVKTIRLDEFFIQHKICPDFIKVDVEGYELLVFRGLSNFDHLNKTTLLFEFVDWAERLANLGEGAAQNYLFAQDFTLSSLYTGKRIVSAIRSGSEMIIAKKN
jgi:FkbM family methyltransferase